MFFLPMIPGSPICQRPAEVVPPEVELSPDQTCFSAVAGVINFFKEAFLFSPLKYFLINFNFELQQFIFVSMCCLRN